LIKSRWVEKFGERRRRFYRLTAPGRKSLVEQKDNWVQYTSAINRIIGITHA
jgi:DNA-binding PadR family transcriptional regulator